MRKNDKIPILREQRQKSHPARQAFILRMNFSFLSYVYFCAKLAGFSQLLGVRAI